MVKPPLRGFAGDRLLPLNKKPLRFAPEGRGKLGLSQASRGASVTDTEIATTTDTMWAEALREEREETIFTRKREYEKSITGPASRRQMKKPDPL